MRLLNKDVVDEQSDEPFETMHVYVYTEGDKKPRCSLSPEARATLITWLVILLLEAGIVALALRVAGPAYVIKTISVPAHFLPLAEFKASSAITPTGLKNFPATVATGALTIYNGSALTQQLPAGFIVLSKSGVEVMTDSRVVIPPVNLGYSPPSYGTAVVAAHVAQAGVAGNIPAYSVNAVYGADLYIKNLMAFGGGTDAKTITYATNEDIAKALGAARSQLTRQKQQHVGLLVGQCQEKSSQRELLVSLTWVCQFATYTAPKDAQVLDAWVVGNHIVLRIKTTVAARPIRWPVK